MEKNVAFERYKNRKGVFYPNFPIIDPEKKREKFKNNMGNQKVKTLELTIARQTYVLLCPQLTILLLISNKF